MRDKNTLELRPKKRIGRIRRGVKLGIIKPIRGGKSASKGKS